MSESQKRSKANARVRKRIPGGGELLDLLNLVEKIHLRQHPSTEAGKISLLIFNQLAAIANTMREGAKEMQLKERDQETSQPTTKKKINTYKIKTKYSYYPSLYSAPKDGYLMSYPKYDRKTGRKYCSPIEFATVEAAYVYLTGYTDQYYSIDCKYDGGGVFSPAGQYNLSHGEYSMPFYTIVSAKSGKRNKEIIAACDALNLGKR